jgi:hypothetical protein
VSDSFLNAYLRFQINEKFFWNDGAKWNRDCIVVFLFIRLFMASYEAVFSHI